HFGVVRSIEPHLDPKRSSRSGLPALAVACGIAPAIGNTRPPTTSQEEGLMMNTIRYAGLMGALGACLSMACSAPAEKSHPSGQSPSPASGGPPGQSPVSINGEMVRIVDHAAHQLWNVEKQGQAPKTDADWENVVEHAPQISAAGALIGLEATGPNDRTFVQQPEWQTFATAVST